MNCPYCKGGPLIPIPSEWVFFCPDCRRRIGQTQDIGGVVAKTWEDVMITPQWDKTENVFWRNVHTNPEMWTDSPTEQAQEKDLLMAELEKKLT